MRFSIICYEKVEGSETLSKDQAYVLVWLFLSMFINKKIRIVQMYLKAMTISHLVMRWNDAVT